MPLSGISTYIFIVSMFIYFQCYPSPPHVLLSKQNLRLRNQLFSEENFDSKTFNIEINECQILQIFILCSGAIILLWLLSLDLCNNVRYVTFNTNLSTCNRKNVCFKSSECISIYVTVFMLGLLFSEYPEDLIILSITRISPGIGLLIDLALKFSIIVSRILFSFLSLFIFSIAVTPISCILCIMVFQILCHSWNKNMPHWLLIILILLSNDVHLNPGPSFPNNFFNFMSWNLNSLAKDNFHRISLIEAHNSLFNYDLISICETSLNDSVELPEPLLNDYTFVHANNPANTRRGGVGLFYKNSFPVVVRNDLSFDETIVVEIKFGRKKIFFTVLYRSPAFNHTSFEFLAFLSNFRNLYSKIMAENPFAMFFTGDYNAHSQFWWPDGGTTPEGTEIENLFTSLGLSQVICEPTNFEPNKNPSCIDLVITNQPNLILDCGTRASLDSYCHHQIIYCKVNFRIPPPPPYERKIWHFNRANTAAIKRSMTSFPWLQHLNINTDPNWQVKTFTDIFLNIMSNCIPNETKRFIPRDPPWITKSLKTMLNRKNRLFKNYKKHRYKEEDKVRLDSFRIECYKAVETAKSSYLKNMGNKPNEPGISQKSYWKIINRVMNKCRSPKIPPLLINNQFILDCRDKAKLFNDFFSEQCKPIVNSSVLPNFAFLTVKRIDELIISNDEISSLIRNINPNKATGSDGISGQMLLICDDSVTLPLKIIFSNILLSSTYPDIWKLANVIPIFKKGDKQLIKNYRPISLLPICGKLFEKIIFNNLYSYLNTNNLITKNQSGFRPGDSTTNQLLYLVNEIHQAFEDQKFLEVRAVFLDISKAFDKVWHDGLIFKLKQNGVSGSLLMFFQNYLNNRKQRVVLNGSYSSYKTVESGVPQGSVLGPLLFLIYINDLERDVKSNIKFFADDTMLFSIVKDPAISANDLNHDLNTIHQWAQQWKMEFNPDPSKQATEVLFSCKKSSPQHPQLIFNGAAVANVNEQKHLGLILDSKLSFEKHLNEKIIKAKKNIGILKQLSKFLPLKTLDQIYKAFVRSHLDYCDIIYHIPSHLNQAPLGVTLNSLMEKVERIQYQAALAISGAWRGSSGSKIYEELGWESLSDRRMGRRILQIHKILNNKTPSYLSDKLPPNSRTLFSGNVRNTFRELICKSNRYMNSFFPDAIASWNIFIKHFDDVPSFDILKKHINNFFRPNTRSIFGIHDPVGLRYLFQLRVSLSPLRSHKWGHNFIDTPSEICRCNQGIEDTDHFLFSCSEYAIHRATLAASVINILQKNNLNYLGNQSKLYLYGDSSINSTENRKIILSTIKYIKDTSRFST